MRGSGLRLVLAALLAGGAIMSASAAGALGLAPAPATCTIEAHPTELPPGGGDVTITGVATPNTTLTYFVSGVPKGTVTTDASGNFTFVVHLTKTANIAVSANGTYPITCDPLVRIRVDGHDGGGKAGGGNAGAGTAGGGTGTGAGAAGNLAFTGSSNTMSIVLVGLALAAVGAILVVAARRRRSVTGRL